MVSILEQHLRRQPALMKKLYRHLLDIVWLALNSNIPVEALNVDSGIEQKIDTVDKYRRAHDAAVRAE